MTTPPSYQLFLCFRGIDVRVGFLSFLVSALKEKKSLNYVVDFEEMRGEVVHNLLERIERSRVVLVIFSKNFMESRWCTKEVLKAMETRGPGKTIIPIFYNVTVEEVKENWSVFQEGETDKCNGLKITDYFGLVSTNYADSESRFVRKIVKEVEKTLNKLETEEKEKEVSKEEGEKKQEITTTTTMPFFGIKKRVQQLKEKLKMDRYGETRVIGVVGMKGIGKTKLAEMLFEEKRCEFERPVFFKNESRRQAENGKKLERLLKLFLQSILKNTENVWITDNTTHEDVKEHLLEARHFLVLDDLGCKEEIVHLLGDRGWITQGSKIVIVTSDKSLVEGLVDDTYVVPGLNEKEGLDCLRHHAFEDSTRSAAKEGKFLALSRKFVDYAKGNPSALTLLGKELWRRDAGAWESILCTLEKSPNKNIQDLLSSCYNSLTKRQRDAFLDITCFFRSQEHRFVKTMVDSSCSPDERSIIKDLADKFLIELSGDRVEMNGLLYTLGKNLASQDQYWRLWSEQDIIKALEKKVDFSGDVRGIFLDISEIVERKRPLRNKAFDGMKKLRYLKIYNSCNRILESDSKFTIGNGLEFPLEEVRYLHWLKFPLEELPKDFTPENLIDLKLPYSHIKRLWNGCKNVKNLKWVDLNHSINIQDLSGLLGAENLERLNLEGCKELKILPEEMMQTMTSLVFLNLRSCTSLTSLPGINMKSLKTLILSHCSSLEEFQMISENLEALYLEGTALKELPEDIQKLQKLVILNMKNCIKLASVPDSLGKLQALQEVILSGCSKLQSFPDVKENMKRLRILLLDGTKINKVPQVFPSGINGLSLLRRLCLSGNDVIETLQAHIGQLYHLKCLDLKDCKKLISLPVLPPNLQCLDAHGCDSLTTVSNPLAFLNLTDQIHSTFIFSQCNNLDEVSKSYIISYIQKKSQLMSTALNRYSLGSVMESYTKASFPGCEVPEWFRYQDYGPKIEKELARHRSENRILGVALCAAVSFQEYRDQVNGFLVKCTCEFKNADGYLIRSFSCTVGGSAKPGIEPRKMESDHVFVCYTSLLQIEKQSEAEEDKKVCSSTTASFKFEVMDGAGELVKCEVLKCGFSMVYEPEGTDDHDNVSWGVSCDESTMVDNSDESTMVDGHSFHDDEPMSSATQEADVISLDGQGSDYDEGQQEVQTYCITLQGNSNTNLGTNSDSVQNIDDEASPIVAATTEIQHECSSGDILNVNGEATLVPTPSTNELHVTPTTAGDKEVSNGEGNTTCFSFLPRFRRKQKTKQNKTCIYKKTTCNQITRTIVYRFNFDGAIFSTISYLLKSGFLHTHSLIHNTNEKVCLKDIYILL